jgi:heme A synthase
MVAVLVLWAWRTFPKRSPIRSVATAAGILIITEALIGAGLVLFELVAGNTSRTRALAGSLHLLNTFLLLAALTLVAYWSGRKELRRAQFQPDRLALLLLSWIGILLIGMSGAITALGDTIFQTDTLLEGIALDLDRSSNFLVRLRWIHPMVALFVSVYIIMMVRRFRTHLSEGENISSGWSLIGLVVIQLLVGPVNLFLLAPVGMQIIHLLLADLVWILLVIFSDNVLRWV